MADPLWPGGPLYSGGPGVFPLGTDSILLADFARPGNAANLLDLGAGGGILTLLLLYGRPARRALGVDISPTACALAEKNLQENGLLPQADTRLGDFTQYRTLFAGGSFDYAVSNPPYFLHNSGKTAQGGLALAREDAAGPISIVCQAASWALRWGGDFALCFRPERLTDLLCALRNTGLEPKRLRPVRHCPSHPIRLLLLEARRGGKPGLHWEPELILFTDDHTETAEYRRIYHRP